MEYENQTDAYREAQRKAAEEMHNRSYPKDDYFGRVPPVNPNCCDEANVVREGGVIGNYADDIADLASYARGFADAADLFASLIEGLQQ